MKIVPGATSAESLSDPSGDQGGFIHIVKPLGIHSTARAPPASRAGAPVTVRAASGPAPPSTAGVRPASPTRAASTPDSADGGGFVKIVTVRKTSATGEKHTEEDEQSLGEHADHFPVRAVSSPGGASRVENPGTLLVSVLCAKFNSSASCLPPPHTHTQHTAQHSTTQHSTTRHETQPYNLTDPPTMPTPLGMQSLTRHVMPNRLPGTKEASTLSFVQSDHQLTQCQDPPKGAKRRLLSPVASP